MKKFFKSIIAVVLAVCLLPCASIFAASPAGPDPGIARPNMTILAGGEVSIHPGDGYVSINVSTIALDNVDKVYHIITINKNDNINLIYKKEYSKKNASRLDTTLEFSAKKGDIFEVIVKHCAEDGSVSESKTMTYYGDY